MHLLPTNLAPIATICANESVRFATTGVKIDVDSTEPTAQFTAVATDGRRLIVCKGECTDPAPAMPKDAPTYPDLPALDSAPNGQLGGIVPAREWARIFREAEKLTRRTHKPILRNVAAIFGEKCSTFAATNLEAIQTAQPLNIDGRFPNWEQVIPDRTPTYEIAVDPDMLAETLTTVSKLGCSSEGKAVILSFGPPTEPIVIRPRARTELETLAIIVPLSAPNGEKLTTQTTTTDAAAEIADLRAELAETESARQQAQAGAEAARAELRERLDELATARQEAADLDQSAREWREQTYAERAKRRSTAYAIRAILPPAPTPDSPAGRIAATLDHADE